ncbi:hypothetical protein [Halorientalis litorea]|jgi:hypothetical protein|uniref:hypothetical protein n=1 Tax=Halorientalis litorea TaxID=2931977 RepID=UPI001FF4B896|nr:hypothetical protein [Halorientalis litorea]
MMFDDDTVDWPMLVVGLFVACGGVLFLAEPVVDPFQLGRASIRPMAASVVALTVGFGLGAVVFLRRGKRLVGIAHGIGAGGWGVVALGSAVGSGTALLLGFAVLLGGSVFLVTQARDLR